MKKALTILFLLALSGNSFAQTLTAGYVPVTNTGGTHPTLKDGTMTDNGNVGIGSANPGAKLDVQGNIRATGTISGSGSISGLTTNIIPKASSSTSISNSRIFDDGTNIGVGTINPSSLIELGTHDINILSNGNVGINSSNPNFLLDVEGNVGLGTLQPFQVLGNSLSFFGSIANGVTGNSISAVVLSSGPGFAGNPLFGSGTWRATTGTGGLIHLSGTLNSSPTNTSGLQIMGGSLGTTEGFRYRGDTNVVGVGNFSPNPAQLVNKFSVAGGVGIGTVESSAYITTAAPNGGLIVEGNVAVGTTAPANLLSVAGNVGIGTFYSTNPGPVNGLSVQGNVGIGTWLAGDSPLHIRTASGTDGILIQANSSSVGSSAAIAFSNTTTSIPGVFADIGSIRTNLPSNADSDLFFRTTGSSSTTEKMRIMSSGGVGIGTSLAIGSAGLTIAKNSGGNYSAIALNNQHGGPGAGVDSVSIDFTNSGSTNPSMQGRIATFRSNETNSGDADLIFSNSLGAVLTEHMRIKSSGNVGIGTSLPAGQLGIGGNCTGHSGLPLCLSDNAGTVGYCPTSACIACNPC